MECRLVRTDDDIATVEKVAREIWHEHYTPIIGSEQVEYMLNTFQSADAIRQQMQEGYAYYLGYIDAEVVGYSAAIVQPASNDVFLSKLYVKRAVRGNGCGRVFLEKIEQLAREHRLYEITLTVNKNNTDSINAYKKLGFSITHPCETDIGNGFIMDDYCMKKTLTSS